MSPSFRSGIHEEIRRRACGCFALNTPLLLLCVDQQRWVSLHRPPRCFRHVAVYSQGGLVFWTRQKSASFHFS